MPVRAGELVKIVEELAPLELAESWDNSGWQVGDPGALVRKVLLALDVSLEVCREAEEKGAELIISHHPLLFRELKSVRLDRAEGVLLARLVQSGISVYSAHTNLDHAAGGVSDALATLLDLQNVEVLQPVNWEKYYKYVVFVPPDHVGPVMDALAGAGAGWIGNYSDCTFQIKGTGTFRPRAGTNPFIGREGELERVEEIRIETIVPSGLVGRVVDAVIRAHPYEEVAYDLYPLGNRGPAVGPGRVGDLGSPVSFAEFVRQVKRVLGLPGLRCGGSDSRKVRRVAVCGGSGADFWHRALECGADVLVTGDVRYHTARDMLAAGLNFVDAGHFGTERVVLPVVREHLVRRCREAGYEVDVLVSEAEADVFEFA